MLLLVMGAQTTVLLDKVLATRAQNVLTYDLWFPTWPFFAVAWVGDAAAVLLIAVRAWRLVAMAMYIGTIALIDWTELVALPRGVTATWRERTAALRQVWAPLMLFVFVIGGLYGGLFTPTEAGGMSAGGAFLIGLARHRLPRTAAAVFTVLIVALLFGYFLIITGTPQKVTAFLTGVGLGFDPVWSGVIIVMTVELKLIHPPVGMNVSVIKSVVGDVSFSTIFRSVVPFIVTDQLRLALLVALPVLATWLPDRL